MPRPKPSILEEVHDLIQWSELAECQKYDPAMFDTKRKNQHTKLSNDNRIAVEVCLSCPVMMQCLEHAVRYGCTDAIYGGLTDEERDEWDQANQVQAAVA